ncbi:AAA family ATPase [Nocardia brasiliensis]|uniref:Regulator n=1 Tax=Nocardia brasiliensis (strain ATCC 700358 / HUJEG-1) TaxID=1133849 RepID=K0F1A7_NOCB7|nr:MoxR family ATPase [Nocardia brasiliensis]AFU03462.1 regulator [Nocardia brasiliensis ATCC 700358]OCF89771.1 ATPase [Nocardia brasiliensis]
MLVTSTDGVSGAKLAKDAPASTSNTLERDVQTLEKAIYEVKRVIVGQDRLVERLLVGVLARGHVLLEGVPGIAKTLAVETFAKVVGGSFSRVQFTPDLVPTDLIGTRIFRQGREEFDTELGPVVANFVLADEINRAPAKVQSALLEVMAERHVSIGGKTYPMPNPFLVMATQNPIESEGVYPLPEAQRDRFLFKVVVDYPSVEEEREIIYRMGVTPPEATRILEPEEIVRLQKVAANVFVHHALVDYVVRVIAATRRPADFGMQDVASWISYGASPRASLGIIAAARAVALIRGRDYVVPQDVVEVIPDVLRHRLVLSYDALADEISPEDVIKRVLQTVGLPQVAPQAVAPGASAAGSPAPQQLPQQQPGSPQGIPQPPQQQQGAPQPVPQPPNGQQSQPAGNVQNK